MGYIIFYEYDNTYTGTHNKLWEYKEDIETTTDFANSVTNPHVIKTVELELPKEAK